MPIGEKILNVLTGGAMQKIGDIIDQAVPDKDLATKIKGDLEMARLNGDLTTEQLRIQAERDVEIEEQKTHQAEATQEDTYTKQTRPRIARQSWYVSCAYAIVCILTSVIHAVHPQVGAIDFQWEVYIAMAAPTLTYMGVRGFDKWKMLSNGNGKK